jgi:hypothetical protein
MTSETQAKASEGTAVAKTHDSVVDQVFDTAIVRAARGLLAAKSALEAGARWLERRAAFVGELATKLEPALAPRT